MKLLLLIASLATTCLSVRPSAGCGHPLFNHPSPAKSHKHQLAVIDPNLGETEREYRLFVPARFQLANSRPVPLVLDYHGYGPISNSAAQEKYSRFYVVADEDPQGFLVATPEAMSDVTIGGEQVHTLGTWNVSRTDGPHGLPCTADRSQTSICRNSCQKCGACDWATCHDDVVFTKTLIDTISTTYCVDLDSVHQTGFSNGGLFSYYVASRLDDFATIAPVAASPMRGFGEVPEGALSIIDFHGLDDINIPYDVSMAEDGAGPGDTVISKDGFYFHSKASTIQRYADGLGCLPSKSWPTHMDGTKNFKCFIHSGCRGGGEVVHCNGNFTHDYPFFRPDRNIGGTRILWSFMKTHPKQSY